jgi:outer membrane receptor protein involved in Fe transport
VTGLEDGLAWVRGHHEIKLGGMLEHYQDNMFNPTFSLGIYTFAGLRQFLQNTPLRFIGISPNGALDRYWRFNLIAFYAQDNWRAHPRLTLNLGVRYEFQTMPADIYGRDSAWSMATGARLGQLYKIPYKNFSPFWLRLGPGKRPHLLRGGYGTYFNATISRT